MHSLKICKQYLNAINERKLDVIMELFKPDGIVSSPLCGTMSVRAFHERLFEKQPKTITRIQNIFATVNSVSGLALHFSHTWLLDNGKSIEIDGIDIFEFTPDGTRFAKLTIVFDPTALRTHLNDSQLALV